MAFMTPWERFRDAAARFGQGLAQEFDDLSRQSQIQRLLRERSDVVSGVQFMDFQDYHDPDNFLHSMGSVKVQLTPEEQSAALERIDRQLTRLGCDVTNTPEMYHQPGATGGVA